MNTRTARVLGIGCAVMALVFVALAGGGTWFARTMKRDYAPVEATERELVAAHGDPAAWTPGADLVPAADRVAAFVRVRRATAEWRSHLERSVVRWRAIQETPNPLLRLMRGLRSAGDAGAVFAGFWTARNEALLAEQMGPGEYVWLYHLIYHARLGHDPGAGAGAVGRGREDDADRAGRRARARLRDLVGAMLERAPAAGEAAVWRAEELVRLEADPERWPWRTDLPPALAASLLPWETELAATWSAAAHPTELLFEALEAPDAE